MTLEDVLKAHQWHYGHEDCICGAGIAGDHIRDLAAHQTEMVAAAGLAVTQGGENANLVSALRERLERAAKTLGEMGGKAYVEGNDDVFWRLRAKREGMTLALSYLDEEIRLGLLEENHNEQ